MQRAAIIILTALLLAGCAAGTTIGTIAGGECALVHTPKYAVLGKTAYDRNWIVTTEESLVRGCNQPRPLARPATLDKPKAKSHPRPKPAKQTAPLPVSNPIVQDHAEPISPSVLDTAPAVTTVPTPKKKFFRWKRE